MIPRRSYSWHRSGFAQHFAPNNIFKQQYGHPELRILGQEAGSATCLIACGLMETSRRAVPQERELASWQLYANEAAGRRLLIGVNESSGTSRLSSRQVIRRPYLRKRLAEQAYRVRVGAYAN